MRNDISSYAQMELKMLYNMWERFKDLLKRFLLQGLPVWLQVQTFYTGLNEVTRQMIDITMGGTLNIKTPEVAMELFEEMTMNNYQWSSSRVKPSKSAHVYDVDTITALAMQVKTLSKKINGLLVTKQQTPVM